MHNAFVPLRTSDQVLGVIAVDNFLTGRPFGEKEVSELRGFADEVALAFAAVARMNLSPVWLALLWLSPMAAAMAFEFFARGRVHKVDAITTTIMAVAFFRVLLEKSENWLVVGRSLLRPFL